MKMTFGVDPGGLKLRESTLHICRKQDLRLLRVALLSVSIVFLVRI